MLFKRDAPYNDLPDLPPKDEIETVPILKKAIRANKAMAELDFRLLDPQSKCIDPSIGTIRS